jgi:hypothetical protein
MPSLHTATQSGASIAGGMHSYYMGDANENGYASQERVPFTSSFEGK